MKKFFITREDIPAHNIVAGQELEETLFRRVNRKRASFGDVLDGEVAEMLGFDYCERSEPPNFDSSTYKVVPAGRVHVSTHRFTQGWSIVPLTTEELDTRAAKYTTNLAQAKASKRAEINNARLRANRASFAFHGKDIAVDEVSRSDIDGVTSEVLLNNQFPAGFPGTWKATDNTYVKIPDIDTWKTFITAMTTQGVVNFKRAQECKDAIEAATTVTQVEAIVW